MPATAAGSSSRTRSSSVGDTAALELDDAVMAAAEGDTVRLERVLGRVFQEGDSPVAVARAMLRHLHRLHALAALVSAGTAIEEAVRNARPPIFFKHQDRRQTPARATGRSRHCAPRSTASPAPKST